MRKSIAFLLTAATLAGCGGADSADNAAVQAVTVLQGARLIDGNGGPAIENSVLVIRGDRIDAVGAAGSVTVPDGAEVIDLTGKTIMPGIINLHSHLALTRGDVVEHVSNFNEENIREKLNLYASYGVLHIVSEGTDKPLVYDIIRKQRADSVPGARLYTAGRGFGAVGGYPPLQPGGTPETDAARPTSPDEVPALVADLASHQVQWVKMWVDPHFGRDTPMSPAIYTAIINAAHENGLRAVAHVFRLADAIDLVDKGVDGLIHSVRDQPVPASLVQRMVADSIFSVSTLMREEAMFAYNTRARYLNDPFFTSRTPQSVQDTLASTRFQAAKLAGDPYMDEWEPAFEMAQRNLKTLFDGGVKIGFGTDSGPPGRFEGYFEHEEMGRMVEAGLTPAQVIQIASKNSAEIIGIAQDYGTVEAGKMAEFLVLGANPLDDIANTKSLEQVWQAGRRIDGN